MSNSFLATPALLKSLTPPGLARWGKMLLFPDYRRREQNMKMLRNSTHYTPCVTDILGTEMYLVDGGSFISMYEEIIENEIYKFTAKTSKPLILDGGANVGLGTIYFKRLYPDCRVIAFEPDEKIFAALTRNVQSFGLQDVELVNKALWTSETELDFFAEGADAGRLTQSDPKPHTVRVGAVRLRDYLHQKIDFLKMDIEGAETEVILDCQDLLGNVSSIFVEYHSFPGQAQTLPILLKILQDSGFRLNVQSPFVINPRPLFSKHTHKGMDCCVIIFGFRDDG